MTSQNVNRREFLKLTAIGVAVAAGTKAVSSKASSEAPKGKRQWAMVIDQSKCTGCEYCTRACQAHNDINPEIEWNTVTENGTVGNNQVFVPRPCMHCEKAPCVEVCPVKASYYRDDGIVMMDYDRCIGCRYCQIACPYGARSFNWEKFTGENPAVPEWGMPEVERRPRCAGKMLLLLSEDRPRPRPGTHPRRGLRSDFRLCEYLSHRRTHVRGSKRSQFKRKPGPAQQSDVPSS